MAVRIHSLEYYISPKYWSTWLGIGVLWCITRLPYKWQMVIGEILGRIMYYTLTSRRHIAQSNISACFPHLTPEQQNNLLKSNFESTGKGLLEIALCWWGQDRQLNSLVEVEGTQHIHSALEQGNGVLLLGSHFTSLILCGRLLSAILPVYALTKVPKNPIIGKLFVHHLNTKLHGNIESNNLRGALKLLKSNKILWYAQDQDFGRHNSVFAEFMGIQTNTLTSVSRIAGAFHSAVIPVDHKRKDDNSGYKIRIRPALENFPSDDLVADARRINEIIEQQIAEAPDQYLWIHRRFKTRPGGDPGIYGKYNRRKKRNRNTKPDI